jgi:hypothetical protein
MNTESPWVLLVFSLPSGKASERVQVWRNLQKIGAISFRNAGYALPNTPDNRERLIWAATSVRSHGGEASVLEIQSIDDLPGDALQRYFREAREPDYATLLEEIDGLTPGGATSAQLARFRRRLEEITAIDFFDNSLQTEVRNGLKRLETPKREAKATLKVNKKDYQKKVWVTRHRPGIDRVSSAWLIRRFIDPKAKFLFADSPEQQLKAIPFDMFGDRGFGHTADCCTFETLCLSFKLRDKRIALIAEAIHDADLEDGKYARQEGQVINRILQGWAKQKIEDHELLQRGMDLIEGLYDSIA